MDVESNEKFGSIGLAGRVQIVEPIVGVAIRLLRSRVNEADYRIQQAAQLAIDGSGDAMQHVKPVDRALHFFVPDRYPLAQRLGRTPFIKHAKHLRLRSVPANARHNARHLSRRNRSKEDDVERIPCHSVSSSTPNDGPGAASSIRQRNNPRGNR